jgi:alpha-ketoglutarate-dependent 2,4-dichlorophenoxyacetate dioxygenase
MTEEESRPLIDFLNMHATRYEFTYRHRWSLGDVVMWDNRCTMHRGRPYHDTQRRVLHRTTVSDMANTVEQEGLVVPAAT